MASDAKGNFLTCVNNRYGRLICRGRKDVIGDESTDANEQWIGF